MGIISAIKHLFGKHNTPAKVGVETLLQNLESNGLSREEAKGTVVYMFMKESQKLKNKQAVEEKAQTINAAIKEEEIDKDWLNRFNGIAEEVSDETMQALWAQILAGEAKKPLSYSIKTLDVLRGMSKKDAEIYVEAMKYQCFENFAIDEKECGIDLNTKIVLTDMGLLSSEDIERSVSFDKGVTTRIINKTYLLKVECEENKTIKLRGRRLTQAGFELLQLTDARENLELINHILKKLTAVGVKSASVHKIVKRDGDDISYITEPEIRM